MSAESTLIEDRCQYSHKGYGHHDLCEFASLPKYTYDQYKNQEKNGLSIPHPFTLQTGTHDHEFLDYLTELPIIVLKKGTILSHSLKYFNSECWWTLYYPGHSSYMGGWFTYGDNLPPDGFNIRLRYMLTTDISIFYIPNYYAQLLKSKNKDYFDIDYFQVYDDLTAQIDRIRFKSASLQKNYDQDREYVRLSGLLSDLEKIHQLNQSDQIKKYSERFSGSHIIQGVKDWKKKLYDPIKHDYYADDWGLKLAKLGFNGYISCDECEVYLTHDIMKKCIEYPFKSENNIKDSVAHDKYDQLLKECWDYEKVQLKVSPLKEREP
jgi:hypothetical protein